jgi:TPR repeat protein
MGDKFFAPCLKIKNLLKSNKVKANVMTENRTISISELQQKANAGDAQAQFELALCYANGEGVEKNSEASLKWLKNAAELGLVSAQLSLGFLYFWGIDDKYTYKLGSMWATQTKKGHVDPTLDLAFFHAIIEIGGKNQSADAKLAFIWFKNAAEQNSPEAQYWLACCYHDGIGIAQNYELAFKWFSKADEQGIDDAEYWLARCFFEGQGVRQSNENGLQVLEKAAKKGIADAQYFLARSYLDGKYAEQNHELALHWLQEAAENRHAEAQHQLANCYSQGIYVEQSEEKAFCWHKRAAQAFHGVSECWLARYYLRGGILDQLSDIDRRIIETDPRHSEYWRNIYLEKGYKYAFEWAEQAVEDGCEEAYLLLGFMYAYGIGVDQDYKEAFEYFQKAVEHDHQGIADYFLADFYRIGMSCSVNEDLANFYSKRAHPESVQRYYDIERLLINADEKFKTRLLRLSIDLNIEGKNFDLARNLANKNPDITPDIIKYVDKSEQLNIQNRELEEKNKQLQQAEKELEDMMAMFAHKFRSPLDAIIYNTTHENQVKLYTEAAQTMRGLLDIFRIISTNATELKKGLIADNQGKGNLQSVLDKTLNMILLHLLSNSSRDKIRQHYIAYAKAHGLCEIDASRKEWREKHIKLEQRLQSQWENDFATLLNQSASLADRLGWVTQHFFALEVKGFDREDVAFEEYGLTESFLTIILNEILVNAFKYYASEAKEPVVLEWVERDDQLVLVCKNPSVGAERDIFKGSQKGHIFLSTLSRNIGSHFAKPIPKDYFEVEFVIPNALLIKTDEDK